jgi:hypothetical protein
VIHAVVFYVFDWYLGLLASSLCGASVPAIRCKYGTRPAHPSSPGFPLLSGIPSAVLLYWAFRISFIGISHDFGKCVISFSSSRRVHFVVRKIQAS